jgi:hypothetical protein
MKTTSYERMAVATEIWRQIRAGVGVTVIMSWGLSKRVATEYNGMPALLMRVTGLQHKGWVYVCLNYATDTYEVYLVTVRGAVKRHLDEVYCDNLGEMLDRLIERGYCSEDAYYKAAMADSARKFNR